ncbi:MAG TPA: hypothetical protein VFC92_06700 [Bacteroidales bacterium]|nr:hypothetical protein [Bacteroidales bacterium]
MNDKKILETVGSITKMEMLSTIEHDTDKALVLETLKPFPGYHGTTVPDHLKPISLFFVTDHKYTGESVIRATMRVKQEFTDPFDAAPGQITIFNNLTPCIRILDLKGYEKIEELIQLYRKNGIDFMKSRNIEPFYGLIKIRKYFTLEIIEPNIYQDTRSTRIVYFTIPSLISWDIFETITHNLRLNEDCGDFDAAQVVFFTPQGVIDTIRLWSEEIDMDNIQMVRNGYLQEFKRVP